MSTSRRTIISLIVPIAILAAACGASPTTSAPASATPTQPPASASLSAVGGPSLDPADAAATRINESARELLNVREDDVQATFDWLRRESVWLLDFPKVNALTEYRQIVLDRYQELIAAKAATINKIQVITREVLDAAGRVPGVDLPLGI